MPGDRLRIAVVGGGGHVGLPLSLLLASKGFPVTVIDHDQARIDTLQRGEFPFLEKGGPELLRAVLSLERGKRIMFCTDHGAVEGCQVIVLTVGTPLDEHLNPDLTTLYAALDQIKPYLHDGQVIILRSTLFPGTSEKILASLRAEGLKVGIGFCPERIAEGQALHELQEFPQIVSGSDPATVDTARRVFSVFAPELVALSLTEAELAKLFTNSWRYIKFAVANQFYTLATEKGLDFYRIRNAMMKDYPRAADFPIAGFAAGPCLFKDTMQLAAYNRQHFTLGHAAMLLNETLPDFLVEQVKRVRPLAGVRVGILGMAFKANSDDPRESLAYKLRKLLQYEKAVVLCTDPYIQDPSFVPLEEVLTTCDILFIGCPHDVYRQVRFEGRSVVDCWGFTRSEQLTGQCPRSETPLADTVALPI